MALRELGVGSEGAEPRALQPGRSREAGLVMGQWLVCCKASSGVLVGCLAHGQAVTEVSSVFNSVSVKY